MVDELRPITRDEYERWNRVPYAGFSNIPERAEVAGWEHQLEPERTLVAIEDGEFVGTTAVLTFEMRVPGGAMLPTAGVTAVSVLPTHRRRGVLSAMMRRQLKDVHERGEALAALWASESLIYGRFGYGMAILGERGRIERVRAAFRRPPPEESGGRVRLVQRDEARRRFPVIYARALEGHTGMVRHAETFWDTQYGPGPWEPQPEKSEPFLAIYQRDGLDEGYVTYRVSSENTRPRELEVRQLYAATPEAHEALWRFIFGVDLVDVVTARSRPVDDALPWLLEDPRRLERSVGDAAWLRLVDVETALAARTYAASGRLVLGVRDRFCPWNDGTYALDVESDGTARCARVGDPPDLEADVDALAAAYLGGTTVGTLARAGRVIEQQEGAVMAADAIFRTERAPWCALHF